MHGSSNGITDRSLIWIPEGVTAPFGTSEMVSHRTKMEEKKYTTCDKALFSVEKEVDAGLIHIITLSVTGPF